MNKKQILKDNIEKIIELYYDKKYTLNDISDQYNCSRTTLTEVMKSYNLIIKDHSQAAKKYHINDNAFEKINSEEIAYWFGFLCADGSISSKRNRLSIGLKADDAMHIKKFLSFLNTNKPIKIKKNNFNTLTAMVNIDNEKICSDLKKLGMYANKSESFSLPNTIPSNFIDDFMRGYIDGDGHIGKKYVIDIIATPLFIKQFEKIYNVNGHKYKRNKMVIVHYQKKDTLILLKKIYYNKKIFLERKYDRAKSLLENPKVQIPTT